jgi:hypothetical protein
MTGQDRATGAMHCDYGVSFVIPLEFEGNGDTVGEMNKFGVIVTEEGSLRRRSLARRICCSEVA